jgi:hypothetical protein
VSVLFASPRPGAEQPAGPSLGGLTVRRRRPGAGLWLAQPAAGRLARLPADQFDQPTVEQLDPTIDQHEGSPLNGPADVAHVVKPVRRPDDEQRSMLYFTDPPAAEPGARRPNAADGGVYALDPRSGAVTQVDDTLSAPDALAGGLADISERGLLFVSVSDGAQKNEIFAYTIEEPGEAGDRRAFFDVDRLLRRHEDLSGRVHDLALHLFVAIEGLASDDPERRYYVRLYVAGPGGIWVVNEKGKLGAWLKLDKTVLACCHTGETLYFATADTLYRFEER